MPIVKCRMQNAELSGKLSLPILKYVDEKINCCRGQACLTRWFYCGFYFFGLGKPKPYGSLLFYPTEEKQ